VQTSFSRSLAVNKGPMDYVKTGVAAAGDALNAAKDAVKDAASTVVDAVSGDNKTDQKTNEAKQHGQRAADNFGKAAQQASGDAYRKTSSGMNTSSSSSPYAAST
ncbi:unnamed protein product, partial [Didymodactylos carnosus]